VYQFYDCLGLKFFYLRNNLHIERLSAGELETLKDSIIEKSPENEEAVSRLVESSWKNIISISEKGADKFIAIYEMNLRGNKEAPGNALVFELATMSSFDENGNFTDFDRTGERQMDLRIQEPDSACALRKSWRRSWQGIYRKTLMDNSCKSIGEGGVIWDMAIG